VTGLTTRAAGRGARLAVLAALLVSTARAAQPGDLERQYLREAAHGNLEHVLLFRHLYGYVALPRTLIMLERSSPDDVIFFVDAHRDATLKDSGTIVPGVFLLHKDGTRRDVDTEHLLPSKSFHTEHRGALTIDYFQAEGDWPSHNIMLTSGVYFLLLTGSAVELANDIARTITALTGPPDVLSPGWHELTGWEDLPSWSEAAKQPLAAAQSP
jgi:hypothetical protein